MNSVQCGSGHGGGHRGGITRKNQFPVTLYHIYVMINYNIFGNFNDASLCCVQCSVCTTAVLECKADCVRVYKCISVYMYTCIHVHNNNSWRHPCRSFLVRIIFKTGVMEILLMV